MSNKGDWEEQQLVTKLHTEGMRVVGVKRTMKFGGEQTHVLTNELKRMFSSECNFAAE